MSQCFLGLGWCSGRFVTWVIRWNGVKLSAAPTHTVPHQNFKDDSPVRHAEFVQGHWVLRCLCSWVPINRLDRGNNWGSGCIIWEVNLGCLVLFLILYSVLSFTGARPSSHFWHGNWAKDTRVLNQVYYNLFNNTHHWFTESFTPYRFFEVCIKSFHRHKVHVVWWGPSRVFL